MRTLLEIRTEVIEDLDLQDSDLISNSDIDRWINKGIRIAQSNIIGIHEPYFLSYGEYAVTDGIDIYDYPGDIFANKIKSLMITRNGNSVYKIPRIDNMDTVTTLQSSYTSSGVNGLYGWIPLNNSTLGRKIQLIPKPTSGTLKIWYIRNAKKLVIDSDICDIDEFEDYVISYAKMKALQKDSNPMFAEAKSDELEYKKLMILTLEDMVISDDEGLLPKDMSFYQDSVNNGEV